MNHTLEISVPLHGIHSLEDRKAVIAAEWRRILPPGMRVKVGTTNHSPDGNVAHCRLELEPRELRLQVQGVEL